MLLAAEHTWDSNKYVSYIKFSLRLILWESQGVWLDWDGSHNNSHICILSKEICPARFSEPNIWSLVHYNDFALIHTYVGFNYLKNYLVNDWQSWVTAEAESSKFCSEIQSAVFHWGALISAFVLDKMPPCRSLCLYFIAAVNYNSECWYYRRREQNGFWSEHLICPPPKLSYFLSSNKHDHPSRLGQLPYVLQLPRDQSSLDNQLMTLLPPLRHPLVSIKAAAFLEVDCCTGWARAAEWWHNEDYQQVAGQSW